MLIPKDQLGEIFDKIHNVWIQTRTTVIILSAADCDSICTTKILTSLLATEMIAYQIHPVLSYEHIVRYNEQVLQERIFDSELHTMVMINCGAMVDLNQMLFERPLGSRLMTEMQKQMGIDDLDQLDDLQHEQLQQQIYAKIDEAMDSIDDNFKIYVIDSHRPFHLQNVHDTAKICLLQGDDEQNLDEFPALDFDDDDTATNSAPKPKPKRVKNEDDMGMDLDDDDDDDDDFLDEEDLEDSNPYNAPTHSEKQRKLQAIKRAQEMYYRLQFSGLNSSGVLYFMARSVQKDDNAMLWNAILGLTESFVYEKIDRDKYNSAVSVYCDEVKRRNETYNAVSTMDSEARYDTHEDSVANSTIISHRHADHIQFSSEFRFTLMRFWTLFDAMYYSRYVATKMGVWKQRGKDGLKYLLAKMALPLNEAQQPYSSMKRQYKAKLPELFEAHGQNEGLDENLTFGSFTKQHGGHASISASDMVFAITAVLESDFRVKHSATDHNAHGNQGSNGAEQKETAAAAEEAELGKTASFDEEVWQSNYFYGYDALSKDKQYLLKNAIKLAKERQKEIVDMGIKLLEKRAIKPFGPMRCCKIENSNNFQSPMLLCKLALFIMDAYKAQTAKRSAKHFVLASYNDKSNSFTVVGIPAKRYIGDVQKSPFYNAFEEARQRVNANAKIVFFEGHVIQIHKDHFKDWMDNLHERLLSSSF